MKKAVIPSRKERLLNQFKNPFVGISIVLFIVATGIGIYSYTQLSQLRGDPRIAAEREAEDLIKQIGKIIVLPEGEDPTVATVSDVESLQEQKFFVNAKNGYKVLIYTEARKAILYDPVRNKIVDIAPLNIEDEELGEEEDQLKTIIDETVAGEDQSETTPFE